MSSWYGYNECTLVLAAYGFADFDVPRALHLVDEYAAALPRPQLPDVLQCEPPPVALNEQPARYEYIGGFLNM